MDRYFDIFLRLPPPRARTHTSWSRLCFLSRHTSIFLSIDNWIECKGEEKNSFCFSRRYVQFWSNDVHSFFDENERKRESFLLLFFSHTHTHQWTIDSIWILKYILEDYYFDNCLHRLCVWETLDVFFFFFGFLSYQHVGFLLWSNWKIIDTFLRFDESLSFFAIVCHGVLHAFQISVNLRSRNKIRFERKFFFSLFI